MSEPIDSPPLSNPPETSAPPQPFDHTLPEPKSFIAHARIIGLITFVSRVLGLAREMIVAQYFGAGPVLSAFKYAFALPNLFRKLLGEGALSAAFIPLYAKALRNTDGKSHIAFASAAVTLQLLVLLVITLLGEAALAGLLWWGARIDPATLEAGLRPETLLALKLALVMLPYVIFVCAAALLGGILQVHRRFVATTATAILLNLLMIIAIIVVKRMYDLHTGAGQRAAVWWLSVSVVVAGVAQAALLVPSLIACGFRFQLTAHFWTPAVRQMLKMTLPVALGLGVLQIGVVLDKQISLMFSPQEHGETVGHLMGIAFRLPMEIGALNRLDWAQLLYQFPLGVFGIALATAIFPQLSGDALDVDGKQFRAILARGIQSSMFIGLPASAGMIIAALPAVRLLFERGLFTEHDSILTARSTAIYSSVIWAFSVQQILNRAYYALHDMRAPLIWTTVNLALNLVIEVPLLWTRLGESAMAVGTMVSFIVQTTVMTLLLARRVGLPLTEMLPPLGKMLVATLGMTIACALVRWLPHWPGGKLGNLLVLGSVMSVGGVTYFALCAALKVPMENLVPARVQQWMSRK